MWHPIETAPKDGTVILLYGEWAGEVSRPTGRREIDIGYWSGGKSNYEGDDWWSLTTGSYYACWMRATHWQPLPAPPEDK